MIGLTRKWAKSLKRIEVVVCPPFPFIHLLKTKQKQKIQGGVQDVFVQAAGSFTGEVSSEMVRSFGAKFAIIGHSERRAMGETDELISKKVSASLMAGLSPIVCIGEKSRDASGAYLDFLKNQIVSSLSGVKKKQASEVIIAYEPVFAIGRSFADAMSARDILETVLYIKKILLEILGKESAASIRILYGGSVNWENASAIIEGGGVDGLLVGRESLNMETFPKLLKTVDVVQV